MENFGSTKNRYSNISNSFIYRLNLPRNFFLFFMIFEVKIPCFLAFFLKMTSEKQNITIKTWPLFLFCIPLLIGNAVKVKKKSFINKSQVASQLRV